MDVNANLSEGSVCFCTVSPEKELPNMCGTGSN